MNLKRIIVAFIAMLGLGSGLTMGASPAHAISAQDECTLFLYGQPTGSICLRPNGAFMNIDIKTASGIQNWSQYKCHGSESVYETTGTVALLDSTWIGASNYGAWIYGGAPPLNVANCSLGYIPQFTAYGTGVGDGFAVRT